MRRTDDARATRPVPMVEHHMTQPDRDVLDRQFGDASAAENLRRAIEAGQVIANEDGTLQLAPETPANNWLFVRNGAPPDCSFLIHFMFRSVYARTAVPHGCKDCYKVKVAFRTLRELVAGWRIARGIACVSKWGVDLNNPYSQNVYAGYFYASGLPMARALYKIAHEAFAADAQLGTDVTMTIKRGCSEYETALGPSDRFAFSPELAEIEAALRPRFHHEPSPEQGSLPLAHWIDVAFRIGDDTYLDFTGGKRLRPQQVTYDPAPLVNEADEHM